MQATRINHVSIPCRDVDESERFYRFVFGLERLPAPRFRRPVRWLRLGDQQLHLIEVPDEEPLPNQHFGLDVDDFETVLVKLRDLGALDSATHAVPLWELPDGSLQLYARDPAGNLLEVNWPEASTVDRDLLGEIRRRADDVPQDEESRGATLYHAAARGA
jgi:catechol 2,3-dioxygenase-like lactoylglutathione lyase family enzyme